MAEESDPSLTAEERFRAAKAHHKAGHLAAARAGYERLLVAYPGHPETLQVLGLLTHQSGRSAEGLALIEQALAQRPDRASFHNNRGLVLQALGRAAEAERAYREALRRNPAYAGAWHNLGGLLALTGRPSDALAAFDRALGARPAFLDALLGRAGALRQLGRLGAAVAVLRRAVEAHPGDARACLALGDQLRLSGRLSEAAAAYRDALRRDRTSATAYNNLGAIFQMTHRLADAEACFRRALALAPDRPDAVYNLACVLDDLGAHPEAEALYQRAARLNPEQAPRALVALAYLRRKLADWTDHDVRREALFRFVRTHLGRPGGVPLQPFSFSLFDTPADLGLALARRQAASFEADAARLLAASGPFVHTRSIPDRLRVGYLSPDFRKHAVGTLLQDVFGHHDRDAVEVTGYALLDVDDAYRRRIEAGCDRFTVLSEMSDVEAARRIHADGVDVLIDLGGYTTYTRTLIPALRPAPVQAHWLGYLGTMGADFLPFVLTDETVLPEPLAAHYSETRVYLPDTFAPTAAMPVADATPTRGEAGLPEEAVVFACFNTHHKIDPACFAVWMRILGRVPGSVLWLYEGDTAAARANLRAAASGHGVAPARLIFAPRAPMPEHLARHRLADLFLDTFAYNAGATAVNALYMGLPVLTMPGASYLSRMGASLTRAAGLPELACGTADAYEAAAVRLAAEPGALADLRRRLAAARTTPAPLFDAPRFARTLEAAFRLMVRAHRDGPLPRTLRVR